MKRFLAEAKRRHVARVALVYVSIAFAVLQGAELIVPRVGMPDSMITILIVTALVGLPIALSLAWVFELTPEGVQRTEAVPEGGQASVRWFGARTIVIAGAAVVLAVTAGWLAGRAAAGGRNARSIAVLAFADMSPQGDQAYFSEGIAEEILNTLANVPGLRVAARTSSFAAGKSDRDIREIGRVLDVAYVLEGSVRKQGENVRITAQLINVGNGYHEWSKTFTRALNDVFRLQEDLAREIARELEVPLGLSAARLVQHRTDTATYELYLQGRALFDARGASVQGAIDKLRMALRIDSNYVPALAKLAEALAVSPFYLEVQWKTAFAEAEAVARRAIALDPGAAAAHTALANVLRDRWEWEPAEHAYKAAIAADSTYPEAYQNYGEFLGYTGRLAEGVVVGKRAVELDPLAPVNRWEYARRLFQIDSLAGAEAQYREGIRLAPEQPSNYYELATTLAKQRRYQDAEAALRAGSRVMPVRQITHVVNVLHALRDGSPVESHLGILLDNAPTRRGDTNVISYIVLGGEMERAFRTAEEVIKNERWGPLAYLLWMSEFDSLRDTPRMQALLETAGFEPNRRPVRDLSPSR